EEVGWLLRLCLLARLISKTVKTWLLAGHSTLRSIEQESLPNKTTPHPRAKRDEGANSTTADILSE
ncbi:MAG: hypothetical protein VXX31_03310, partial [Planctomycetota bacterium]|nr:hypothetical protein [Planctomycetota bacterium]